MSKTAMIRARMEPDLKEEAEAVLAQVGLSPTEAIRLFYRQVTLRQGLPFEVRVPNTATRQAIKQARGAKKNTATRQAIKQARGAKKLKRFKSAADLIRSAGA